MHSLIMGRSLRQLRYGRRGPTVPFVTTSRVSLTLGSLSTQTKLFPNPEASYGVRCGTQRFKDDVGALRTMWSHRNGRLRLKGSIASRSDDIAASDNTASTSGMLCRHLSTDPSAVYCRCPTSTYKTDSAFYLCILFPKLWRLSLRRLRHVQS